jgi:hypothetical protein
MFLALDIAERRKRKHYPLRAGTPAPIGTKLAENGESRART